MSDIARSMVSKGYTPLAADNFGGIGFRKSLKADSGQLSAPVWFDTGLKMKGVSSDGQVISVSRTACAYDESRYKRYLERGWKPIIVDKEVNAADKQETN